MSCGRCEEGNDPRNAGRCFRCGMPVVRVDRDRDIAVERELTREAAKRVAADPEPLVLFAEARSDKGPVRDFPTRDFEREVREELADARNYLVWGIYQAQDRGEDPRKLFACLARVASAYAVLSWQD